MTSTSPKLNISIHLTIIILVLSVSHSTVAQERDPARGFKAGNSYSISEIENVNLSNGNLMLNIPLATLPGGRGTSPGYTVTLRYNSKIWNSRQERGFDNIPDENGSGYYYRELLERSYQGGWYLDAGEYHLNVINRHSLEEEAQCTVGNGPEYIRNAYRYKLEMQMPDGSVKEFRPYGTGVPFNDLYGDAWYSIDPGGGRDIYSHMDWNGGGTSCSFIRQQITTAGMHYYTNDGSGIRLYIPYGEYHGAGYFTGHWKMYMPDGSLVENSPPDDTTLRQRVTDRNGNKLLWKVGPDGRRIEDEVGHYITYADGTVTQKGVGGEILRTDIEWADRWVHREYPKTHAPNSNPGSRIGYVREGLTVVTRIKLPTQAGGLEYQFTYNGDEEMPTVGNYTDGWGELKSVRLPSGARADYSYSKDGSLPVIDAFEVVSNSVTKRNLTYLLQYGGTSESQTDTTVYAINGSGIGVVTTPDGAMQTEVGPWTGSLKGYAYRILKSGGSAVEKLWTTNDAPRVSGGGSATNPYVKTEFTTVADANGNPALTAIKDFDYDKNGNLLEVRDYDWVPYGSVPRNGGTIYTGPSGLPPNLILKRRTVNAYYNPTPIATDFITDSQNHYANPSSPRLHNVIKSTEIQDGNGVVASRTEFFYDDPSNRGNLIETRSWDSTKGSLAPPDALGNRLNSSNSISTRTEYDSYGNAIKTTDARGVESTVTFGSIAGPNGNVGGLYPTQTVTASNYASVKRTATAGYDFWTGLVTNATDVDNNVSSVTEYDALGRATKLRRAAGTPLESWTRSEYDDVNRLVVTRSDIEALGDGRKVGTTFLDQLGRVRLTKTLEDSTTQSATNETDGIKIETRYGYNDPTPSDSSDPQNTLGTYTAVSNPFRAARATDAGNEETMGWSRSYSANTARYNESETFSGGSPPAPWGSNNDTTGVVKTETDASATTVTDQAGKKRRSILNAFGQLVRLDEPNGDGQLDVGGLPFQSTDYTHDPLNNLVGVTQGIQRRTFVYSSLSRLTSESNPESGLVSYQFDNNGNVTRKTDARGVVSQFLYDALDRMTRKSFSGETGYSTPPVDYVYDEYQNSKGRLTKVTSSVSENRYISWDKLGRLLSSQQIIDGQTFATGYSYSISGFLLEQTYPSGRKVKNTLDRSGNLSQVQARKDPQRGYWSYARNISHSAPGILTSLQLGNGRWESINYNSRLQPTRIALGATKGTSDLLKVEYAYGGATNNGNLTSETISVPNAGNQPGFTATQHFTYDSLDRLHEAFEMISSSQTWRQTFAYDRYGNRSFMTGPGQTTTMDGCPTAQCNPTTSEEDNRITSPGYDHDGSGNTTRDARDRLFQYDAENRQVKIDSTDGAGNPTGVIGLYFYGADGRRVKKMTDNETTVFVYDASGKLIQEMSTHVNSGQDAKVAYVTTDRVRSPRIVTDANGVVTARHDYHPFGEEIGSGTLRRSVELGYVRDDLREGFTGYEKDDEARMDFAVARMYNFTYGRFSSPDPSLADQTPTTPQSWNLFQRTLNNPLKFIDPSGMWHTDANGNVVGDYDGECVDEIGACWDKKSGNWEFGGDKTPVQSTSDSDTESTSSQSLLDYGPKSDRPFTSMYPNYGGGNLSCTAPRSAREEYIAGCIEKRIAKRVGDLDKDRQLEMDTNILWSMNAVTIGPVSVKALIPKKYLRDKHIAAVGGVIGMMNPATLGPLGSGAGVLIQGGIEGTKGHIDYEEALEKAKEVTSDDRTVCEGEADRAGR